MISVVIPAHNEAGYLPTCLKSIKQQTLDPKRYEVIVVDDHSDDQTATIAKQFGVKVIKSKVTPGKSSALNQGVEIAEGEIITAVDADSQLPPNFLAKVKEAFESDPHLDAYTGVGRLVDKGRTFYPELLCSLTDLVSAFLFRWFPFLTGPGHAVRKSTLEKVGGYPNEAFEDLALAKELKKVGAKIKLDRAMKVFASSRRYKSVGKIKIEWEIIRAYLRKHLLNKANLWQRSTVR